MKKKLSLVVLTLLLISKVCYGAFDATAPANDSNPATEGPKMRANWTALDDGSAPLSGTADATFEIDSDLTNGPAATISKTGIVLEGTTADAHETTITVTEPTTDKTVTIQDETGTVIVGGSTTANAVAVTINDDGSNSDCQTTDNDGTGHGHYIKQDGVLALNKHGHYVYTNTAQTNSPLVMFDTNNGSSDKQVLYIENAGTGTAISIAQAGNTADPLGAVYIAITGSGSGMDINPTSGTSSSHLYLRPVSTVAGTTEGEVYTDTEDGVLYYRSSSNWAACNTDADYAETFGIVGNISDYEEGDVVVISSEKVSQAKINKIKNEKAKYEVEDGMDKKGKIKYKKVHSKRKETRLLATALKVEKSSSPYQRSVVGILCFRSAKGWSVTDEAPIALLGKVPCNVTNEGGAIATGDLLTTSSTEGYAMKATIDSFAKIGSVIGKAREPFTGTKGKIEIIVGVK